MRSPVAVSFLCGKMDSEAGVASDLIADFMGAELLAPALARGKVCGRSVPDFCCVLSREVEAFWGSTGVLSWLVFSTFADVPSGSLMCTVSTPRRVEEGVVVGLLILIVAGLILVFSVMIFS